jgi:hypothetical protein
MYRHHEWLEDDADVQTANRQTGGLVGIVIVLMLLIGGLFLVQQLRQAATIQDCVMTGRTNCQVVGVGPR